jgi:hypothetical protein
MRLRPVLLAAGLLAAATLPASANINIYYHAGGWDAFDDQGDSGQPVCGIGSRNPADGRTFSLSFQIGSEDVTFRAAKPGWAIPQGTQIPVVVQIGLERPWTEQAMGDGDTLHWTMDRTAIQSFDVQFRRATSMTVTFPTGNERPWIISLAGSTAVSDAMGRCVTDMSRRASAAQPAPAPTPGQTTQPFGAAPAGADRTGGAQGSATQGNATQGNAAPDAAHRDSAPPPGNPSLQPMPQAPQPSH